MDVGKNSLSFQALIALFALSLGLFAVGTKAAQGGFVGQPVQSTVSAEAALPPLAPESLIRFHVVANSDSEMDQDIKRAVRDAILEDVSPRLGRSHSLEQSRELLKEMLPEMNLKAQAVVRDWGQAYPVRTEYGKASFPTKSYGSLILPAGEYEAVRILIGEAVGANWWCVLFPPLCFIDIDQATAVPVDGKPGVPIQHSVSAGKPKVRFWIWEKLRQIFL